MLTLGHRCITSWLSLNRSFITRNVSNIRIMAIPVTNIPVLTGEVAERFIEQCEYNAKHLAGSEWSQEREDRFNRIMERSLELQRKLGVR